ncbi:hypothetical protein B5X24_HaOG210197 [Helicoverpa armigera]|uniref:Uncharacterized protein n=1 Tax=Helicoverpa armigera TaxID=29058 RepID=A0A2W1BCJ9_HELAM|nr:hypothetical protein B5X24_HaOG210197 [Helicoverpa armigera]
MKRRPRSLSNECDDEKDRRTTAQIEKLILILVLVAIGAAVAPHPTAKTPIARSPTAKSPAAKSSVGKKISNKNSNHTSKRELYEGNFGDKTVLGVKYAVLSSTPRTDYSDDLKKIITEQTSDAQVPEPAGTPGTIRRLVS